MIVDFKLLVWIDYNQPPNMCLGKCLDEVDIFEHEWKVIMIVSPCAVPKGFMMFEDYSSQIAK